MLRFDKATNLSLLFKFVLSERLINYLPVGIRCFTIFRFHKCSIHSVLELY